MGDLPATYREPKDPNMWLATESSLHKQRYRRRKCAKVWLPQDSMLNLEWANSYKVLCIRQVTSKVLCVQQVKLPSRLPFHWTHSHSLMDSPRANIFWLKLADYFFFKFWNATSNAKDKTMLSWSIISYRNHMLQEFMSFLLKSSAKLIPASVNSISSQPAKQGTC